MSTWDGSIPCHLLELPRAVYVEVPKSGCTSMKVALAAFRDGDPPIEHEWMHKWFGYSHSRSAVELDSWLRTRWASWFTFTLVRHPIPRFESLFYDKVRRDDINQYVLKEFEHDREWRDDIHAVPQTHLIGTDLSLYDFVGRLEDTITIERTLTKELHTKVVFPHLNATPAKRQRLSQAATAKLHDLFRTDFEVLGYDG